MIIAICSGGRLGEWALPYIKQADYIIGVDHGAYFILEHGIPLHLAMGDFDSVTIEQSKEIQKYSQSFTSFDAVDKYYTDTQLAVMHALELKPQHIVIVGALGTRLDHSLSNIHLLELALKQQVSMRLIDEHNTIQLMDHTRPLSIERTHYRYVSLLPHTQEVADIKLSGFKYPLTDTPLSLTRGLSIGISNELLAENGSITISSGQLLVIQAND
jgi:thiamine pyrophosphokinase